MSAHPRPTLHHRVFSATVIWTLGLLLLGSVVHATDSSLACPDWPTCFGTMVPEMVGGVFWEHLHRLVAGGLVILWAVGTWFLFRDRPLGDAAHAAPHRGSGRALRVAVIAGLALLLVQSVFGGLTVLWRLPDAVSTTHLGLAFLFLALATVVAVETNPRRSASLSDEPSRRVRRWVVAGAVLVFMQSLLGALVRHTDSGLACPDVPLCLGELVPPLEQWPIALHFAHRAMGVVVVLVVTGAALAAYRHRRHASLVVVAAVLTVSQAVLGFVSVALFLTPWAVSLHTLLAASILAALVAAATLLSRPLGAPAPRAPYGRRAELARG